MLFSVEEPPSPSRASSFPGRPEARPQAPPARPRLWVHPGSDAEPTCPYNLWLMIISVQGSAPSRVHQPQALLPLRSTQPRAVPSPSQGDHSSPGSAVKASRRRRQRAPPAAWRGVRMAPASSSSTNDPHQSAVTELSVTGAKVPAAATGARRSSIRGMKSELASPGVGDRWRVPVLGVGQGQPQPRHPEPAGLKELGAAKLPSETCSSWDSRDSGPGCSPVPERGERLHDPWAEQAPKGDRGMGQKGPQSRAGLTAVLSPFPSTACDSAPRQPGCAQRRCWQNNNFSGHTTYKML